MIKVNIKDIVFGVRVKGEPIGEAKRPDGSPRTTMTVPGLIPRPSYNEWCNEFSVSRLITNYEPLDINVFCRPKLLL